MTGTTGIAHELRSSSSVTFDSLDLHPDRSPDLLGTLEQLLTLEWSDDAASSLSEVADIIGSALGAGKVDVFLYDPDTDSLVSRGAARTAMGRRQAELGLHRLPLSGEGRTVEVFRSGVPYATSDAAEDDNDDASGIVELLEVRSRLAVPLCLDGVPDGVLEVCAATSGLFTAQDLRFLTAAARWLGARLQQIEQATALRKRSLEEGRRRAAEEIFAVLAHDLRNILASAIGRATLLHERASRDLRELDARDAGLLGGVLGRLVRMTNNLLDVSRLERGLFALDARPADLVQIARQAVASFRRPGVELEERYPSSAMVHADPERIAQALENLIANALQHTPPDGTVRVQIELAQDAAAPCCVVRVIDQGPGVPPELLPRIFERYVSNGASRGLGLGLYLARGIAAAHGGSLCVRSAATGATFELSLPLSR